MVVALVLLAIAMIAGGSAAAAFGWDIVLLERGWVMVIGGSTVAASGALVLAVAAVAARLGRIRRELSDLSERLARNELTMAREAGAPVPPVASVSTAGASTQAAEAPAGPTVEEPPLPLFMQAPREDEKGELPPGLVVDSIDTVIDSQRDRAEAKPAAALTLVESDNGPEKPEPAAVVPLFPERMVEARGERPPEIKVYDAKESGKPAAEVPPPPVRDEPEPATEDKPSPHAEPEEPPEAAVIGSYTSGDNRYVMFADGSISAHTPTGVFRFGSLDELKEFIAAGGEGASHG